MSQRVKKPDRSEESQGKRRRRRPSGSDADEDGTRSGSNSGGNGSLSGMWTPRHLNDLKVSSIYNRNSAEAPAELYRKDLISAMKLADSEPLTAEEYWLITDPWKQEWEKGVQVPVNPESLPEPEVVVISPVAERSHDFRLPKKKYVRVTHDDFFNPDYHQLVSTAARAEKVCSYDLDDVDAAWLGCSNADRGMQSLPVISEFLMEQVIEELELQCWEQVQTILKSQEGLGIEYDENVICDVCRSPESEEGNEMVFCDSCNICVHQACYGITAIPSGSWLCRTCTLGIRPSCVLCPNIGGAMKATRSGHKWAHVACAIWIPEVSIGSVEKMEPITKISSIPPSRWSLLCVLCKDKVGACIQCSVKTCKTAYHVTCAFKNGLEMKPIIVDENAEDGIKLRSYCEKHSVNTKKDKSVNSGSEEDSEKKKARAMTAEERNQARAEKLQQIEAEFYKYVRLKDVSQNLAVDMDIVNLIYNYWKLKRKSLNNRPLVPPRPETTQLLTQQQEQDLEQMKMFVQLRQDLERVRNLCYMVSRREKLSRTFFRLREQTFQKQVALLSEKSIDLNSLPTTEKAAILDANHGPSIYDIFYSHAGVLNSYKDYDSLMALIMGEQKKDVLNGAVKESKGNKPGNDNPYRKTFVNGARRRNLLGESCSSMSEDESIISAAGDGPLNKSSGTPAGGSRKPLSYLFDTDSSNDENDASGSTSNRGASSSLKSVPTKGRGLKQMEQLLNKSSTSDSDELDMLTPASSKLNTTKSNLQKKDNIPIYSDSESEVSMKDLPNISSNTANNTSNNFVIATKGALKEFSGKRKKETSEPGTTVTAPAKTRSAQVKAKVEGKRKKGGKFDPTELIVPQREAAKKASESIRTVKCSGKTQPGVPGEAPDSPIANFSGVSSNGGLIKDKDITFAVILSKEIKNVCKILEKSETSPEIANERPKPKKVCKSKSTDKKAAIVKKISKSRNNNQVIKSMDDPVKDEYEFELGDEGGTPAKSVSYVPQRQAAKKAAEHIRSGLSNIVAARLIIEDEMEASRKKAKSDLKGKKNHYETSFIPVTGKISKSVKSPFRESFEDISKFDDGGSESSRRSKSDKDRPPFKDGELSRAGGKRGKKELAMKSDVKGVIKENHTGWPFLDKRSQSSSSGRRSRERSSSSSSSSSGSSSSGSSSCSHSSSSSRSSSPDSASPEPTVIRKSPIPVKPTQSSPVCSTSSSPGTKLKTSERVPINRPRSQTPPRAKPPSKGRRPKKSGPRRGSASSPLTSSTNQSPSRKTPNTIATAESKTTSTNDSNKPLRRPNATSSTGSTGQNRNAPSPSRRKTCCTKDEPQEKSPRRTREPKVSQSDQERNGNVCNKARTSPKTVIKVEQPELSSDSEPDKRINNAFNGKASSPLKFVYSTSTSISNTATVDNELRNKPMPKTKKKELGLISDSENSLADEKENSCLSSIVDVSSPKDSPKKAQKPTVPVVSVMSPLTPSSENKEKEHSVSRSSDTEPETKRARLDTTIITIVDTSRSCEVETFSNSIPPISSDVTSTSFAVPAPASPLHSVNTSKSIFSPSGVCRAESELLDFDTDLYDLARSVTEDCSQVEGEERGQSSGSLSFSFSQDFICREDNKEDSALATLNLVEKLRLQHARKSGTTSTTGHRPSTENSSDVGENVDDQHQPISPLSDKEESGATAPKAVSASQDEILFSPASKSPNAHSSDSHDMSKSILGDERWVPPSGMVRKVSQDSSPSLSHSLPQPPVKEPEFQSPVKIAIAPPIHPLVVSLKSAPAEPEIAEVELDVNPKPRSSIDQNTNSKQLDSRHGYLQHENQAQNQNAAPFDKIKIEIPVSIQAPEVNSGHFNINTGGENRFNPTMHSRQFPVQPVSNQMSTPSVLIDNHQSMAPVTLNNLISPSTLAVAAPTCGMNMPQNVNAQQLQLPFGASHQPPGHGPSGYPRFLYPLTNSALASVVSTLTSQFFQPTQSPVIKTSTPLGNQNGSGTAFSSTFPPHFIPVQQLQQQQGQISPPTPSPALVVAAAGAAVSRRRSSEGTSSLSGIGIESTNKDDSDSIVSAVTSAMPPLSMPPLSSPSVLLAASKSTTITPQLPPKSTVAQIIESVVNNHSVTAAGTQGKSSPLSNVSISPNVSMHSADSSVSNAMSNLGSLINSSTTPSTKLQNSSTTCSSSGSISSSANMLQNHATLGKSPILGHGAFQLQQPPNKVMNVDSGISDFSAVLSNKTENIIPPKAPAHSHHSHSHFHPVVPVGIAVSPKGNGGRGKRPTTPRAKVERAIIDEVGPKGNKGRGERKTSTSPARGSHKPITTPRRGPSRGRGKGKGVVGVRKDLAGTVYDIDFDEFEENSEEKFDLRMLRERRKSSDFYAEAKKSESSNASPAHFEKSSPRYRSSFESESSNRLDKNMLPNLQAPLPGPVDMRTYNSSVSEAVTNETMRNISFPQPKDSNVTDIASLFLSNTNVSGTVNDLEELDNTLEALTSSSSANSKSFTTSSSLLHTQAYLAGHPQKIHQQQHLHEHVLHHHHHHHPSSSILLQKNNTQPTIVPGSDSSLSNSKDSDTPSLTASEGDSRNQLKFKIKGPFLDANYASSTSSHSLPPRLPEVISNYTPSLHHNHSTEPSHPTMMNIPSMMNNTSNLRRMRKKELLRQYWTQDMNMDGSALNPSYSSEMGMSTNTMTHPINRSVITIPKAVASMAIIPTKEDYRMDDMFDDEAITPTNSLSLSLPGTDKKRRNRGGSREIAALGILPPDEPRERRRDRSAIHLNTANLSSEPNARKRGRTNSNKVSRSTFIPPTLVEAEEPTVFGASGESGCIRMKPNIFTSATADKQQQNSFSNVINTVNHPTPKLKIKFGSDLSSVNPVNNVVISKSSNLSDSDKETPTKKAKGRPPKKRGLAEVPVPVPPTMEELKRQSMKFREMIMQDFAVAEKREILALTGTRRHKKSHKGKKGVGGDSETDDSNRSKSPEVKVVTEITPGSKLILRIKSRASAANSLNSCSVPPSLSSAANLEENYSNSATFSCGDGNDGTSGLLNSFSASNIPSVLLSSIAYSNEKAFDTYEQETFDFKSKENDPIASINPINNSGPANVSINNCSLNSMNFIKGDGIENDSGFMGSSEGSSGSGTYSASNSNCSATLSSTENNLGLSKNKIISNKLGLRESTKKCLLVNSAIAGSSGSATTTVSNANSVVNSGGDLSSSNLTEINSIDSLQKPTEKIMPIRLKLSRCFEGYDGWKKKDKELDKGNPKQSDSCEVR